MAAVRQVFSDGEGRDRNEAIRDIARCLDYRRAGSRIRETIAGSLRAAVRRGIIFHNGSTYAIDCRTISDYSRDDLIRYLLSSMGNSWCDRRAAITTAGRYLGFRRIGPKIQTAFKSAINAALRRGLLEKDGPDYIRRT